MTHTGVIHVTHAGHERDTGVMQRTGGAGCLVNSTND